MKPEKSARLATFKVMRGKLKLQIQVLKSIYDVHNVFEGTAKAATKKHIAHASKNFKEEVSILEGLFCHQKDVCQS